MLFSLTQFVFKCINMFFLGNPPWMDGPCIICTSLCRRPQPADPCIICTSLSQRPRPAVPGIVVAAACADASGCWHPVGTLCPAGARDTLFLRFKISKENRKNNKRLNTHPLSLVKPNIGHLKR